MVRGVESNRVRREGEGSRSQCSQSAVARRFCELVAES